MNIPKMGSRKHRMGIKEAVRGEPVEVREEQGRIVIEPIRRKEYKLDELLGGITGKNLHKPIDTGVPVGKEVW